MADNNPMQEIRLGKVVLNIGTEGPGERLEKAKGLLEELTGKEAKITKARRRIAFGLSKGRDIGAMVTLRDEDAEEFLERVLVAKEHKIRKEAIDNQGNFSIGLEEHIDLPDTDYDPDLGIFGMDIAVTLQRPGFRIKKKKISKKIGKNHKITKEDTIDFLKNRFDVEVIGD